MRWFLLVAVLVSCKSHGSPSSEDRSQVAVISGVPIYTDEFKREFKRIRLDDEDGLPAAGSDEAQKRSLLNDLIARRLVLQEAEHKNVIVASDEVDAAYDRTRAGWADDDFTALLSEKDMTPTELKAELRELLTVRKYFRDHVFSRLAVTDQEIEAYLDQHTEKLLVPEQVRARHIVVRAEEEAQKVLTELRSGTAFEDAAMKYSLSPDGQNGGDLGFFARGVMPRVFDETCFSLAVGQISKPVPSEYGFHLFKVLEHKPEQVRPKAMAQQEVELELRRAKEREAEQAKVAELRKMATISIQEEQLARIH